MTTKIYGVQIPVIPFLPKPLTFKRLKTKHFSNTTSHLRSTSTLPSTSHPLISQLKDHLSHLKSWASTGSIPDTRTSAWLCDGFTRLKTVHNYLDDILRLPQTQNSLRRHTDWIEKLLQDFLLRFFDAYGIFQTLIFALKREHSAAQLAVRRKVDSKIEIYAKAMRKMDKEMGDLVSGIRCMRNSSNNFICNVDAELVEVMLDVKEVTVLVSTALFCSISLSILVSKKASWIGSRFAKKGRVEEGIQEFKQVGTEICLWGLRMKGDEEYLRMVLKRMNELEDCIVKIEMGSERVFRSLINTRVSVLLNVLTK